MPVTNFGKTEIRNLIDALASTHTLTKDALISLILDENSSNTEYLARLADKVRRQHYGNQIFIRGLIEISNYCRNDCYYCGIRCSQTGVNRYRLDKDAILKCCKSGYDLGFRTFVMQGGEDPYYTDNILTDIISTIRSEFPDCAITLSLGERSRESYKKLYMAGADRYLLRHETSNPVHYSMLHPSKMSFDNRLKCLHQLKEIGFQTGCGFMIGSPGQTVEDIASDILFIKDFAPQMVGIGPFIPAAGTPFEEEDAGSGILTCKLLSIIRLMLPNVLLPATTALGTLMKDGRQLGIKSGANVVMPNLSPDFARKNYQLYDNKLSSGQEAAESVKLLSASMAAIGYEVTISRGDFAEN